MCWRSAERTPPLSRWHRPNCTTPPWMHGPRRGARPRLASTTRPPSLGTARSWWPVGSTIESRSPPPSCTTRRPTRGRPPATWREAPTAILRDDGRVPVARGYGAVGNDLGGILSAAELFDPATDTWSSAGNMTSVREDHAASLLEDGRVLVTGGTSPGGVSNAELYDPTTNTWSPTVNMSVGRRDHTSTLLQNGMVLVVGGVSGCCSTASVELYDPFSVVEGSTSSTRTDGR